MQGVAMAKEEEWEEEARTITHTHKEEAQHVGQPHLPREAGQPWGIHLVEEAQACKEDVVERHSNKTHHRNCTATLDPNHRLPALA